MFFLAVASDWVQLPTVEPGGKLKFKTRLCGNEEDCQIKSPEANRKIDEIQMKAETVDTLTKFVLERASDIITDQFIVNTGNDESGIQIYNTQLNLNHDNPVRRPSISNSHYSKPESHDSTENNYESHMSENTFIQPPLKLSFEYILEKDTSDSNTPQFKAHLASSSLNKPNFQPTHELLTTMELDAKLPNPGIHDHPSDKDSTSESLDSFYETSSSPYPAVKQNDEDHEGIITIMKPNVSSIDAESQASWISRRGNRNNETEGNTVQDGSLPLDMLKAVHETLIQETPHTIRGKIHFLQQLKDKMLHYLGKVIILYSTLYFKLL
jgi:hypothetical protein